MTISHYTAGRRHRGAIGSSLTILFDRLRATCLKVNTECLHIFSLETLSIPQTYAGKILRKQTNVLRLPTRLQPFAFGT